MVKLLPLEVLQCLGITENKSQTPCHGLNPGSSHNMHSSITGLQPLSVLWFEIFELVSLPKVFLPQILPALLFLITQLSDFYSLCVLLGRIDGSFNSTFQQVK